jgi:hypothetical protein
MIITYVVLLKKEKKKKKKMTWEARTGRSQRLGAHLVFRLYMGLYSKF